MSAEPRLSSVGRAALVKPTGALSRAPLPRLGMSGTGPGAHESGATDDVF